MAGPVVAAAVHLIPPHKQLCIPYLDDSKRLSPTRRRLVYEALLQSPVISISYSLVSSSRIDAINILNARLEAMTQAVTALSQLPGLLFVDGNLQLPDLHQRGVVQRPIVRADEKVSLVAAASIVCKVIRDDIMTQYATQYPQYLFQRHVGYATPLHLQTLRTFGPCRIHRMSYKPVRKAAVDLSTCVKLHSTTPPFFTQ